MSTTNHYDQYNSSLLHAEVHVSFLLVFFPLLLELRSLRGKREEDEEEG